MAYNEEKLTRLKSLKQLAQKINEDFATKDSVNALDARVTALEDSSGEANVITEVKVNGAVQTITDKAVDISVPVKVSDLDNDSKFQSDAQVEAAIQAAISATGHASFERADAVPDADTAKDNVLYLVMNAKTNHYDIYAKVSDEVVLLDDTSVDVDGYVEKEDGKGLSANDFTDAEKSKLATVAEGATKVEATAGSGTIKINGTQVTLFDIATDAEVTEMLTDVFGD